MTSLPNEMTSVEIVTPGGPEALQAATIPVPVPGHDEVLVKVAAAGVNRPDVAQRQGGYPPPPGAPATPGLEIAGEIVALGTGVTDLKVGDEICALVAGGGYAEYCTAPAPQCLPIPAGYSMVEAAALPETFFTVWTNVFQRGALKGGERVLIHGGSSGIGTTAIQLAHARGARVFATAGNEEKCKICEDLGAEKAINYKTEDYGAIVKELTGGEGVDLILDMVGGDYIMRNLDALAVEGRLVQIAFLNGPKDLNFNMLPIMLKRLTVSGSTLRPRSVEQKAQIAEELRQEVWPLLENGTVKPIIDSTYPLKKAAAAHARMESSQHIGKIMLEV